MTDAWYYAEGDKAVGPVTLADLKKLLSLVSNAKDVLVWKPGFANWERAETVPELALVPKPPPLPRSAAREPLTFWWGFLIAVALNLFIYIFMPETWKTSEGTGTLRGWLLFMASMVIALIAYYGILARFLSAKAWDRSGRILVVWLLMLIGFALMLRFFA